MCLFSIVLVFVTVYIKTACKHKFYCVIVFSFCNRSLLIASVEASPVFRQQVARVRGAAIYAGYNGRVHAFKKF